MRVVVGIYLFWVGAVLGAEVYANEWHVPVLCDMGLLGEVMMNLTLSFNGNKLNNLLPSQSSKQPLDTRAFNILAPDVTFSGLWYILSNSHSEFLAAC